MQPVLMNQADYARYRGVSRQAIGKHVEAGKIALDAAGMIDAAAADLALGENRSRVNTPDDDEPERGGGERGSGGLTKARTAVTAIQARRQYLVLDQELGLLVETKQVRDAATQCAETLVRIFASLPGRAEQIADAAAMAPAIVSVRGVLKQIEFELREQAAKTFERFAADALKQKKAEALPVDGDFEEES